MSVLNFDLLDCNWDFHVGSDCPSQIRFIVKTNKATAHLLKNIQMEGRILAYHKNPVLRALLTAAGCPTYRFDDHYAFAVYLITHSFDPFWTREYTGSKPIWKEYGFEYSFMSTELLADMFVAAHGLKTPQSTKETIQCQK